MLRIVHRIKSLNSLTMSMCVDQAQYVTFKGQTWNKWFLQRFSWTKKWLVFKNSWTLEVRWLSMWCILVMVMAGSRFTSGVWLCALLLESTHVTFTSSFIFSLKSLANMSNPCVYVKCTFYKLHKHTCWSR